MKIKKEKDEIHLHVKFSRELHKKLAHYAAGQRLTVSDLIRKMVDHQLNWVAKPDVKKHLEIVATIERCANVLKRLGGDSLERQND
jgi:hypothetical protein